MANAIKTTRGPGDKMYFVSNTLYVEVFIEEMSINEDYKDWKTQIGAILYPVLIQEILRTCHPLYPQIINKTSLSILIKNISSIIHSIINQELS